MTMVHPGGQAIASGGYAQVGSTGKAKWAVIGTILLCLLAVGLVGVTAAGVLKINQTSPESSTLASKSGLPSVDALSKKGDLQQNNVLSAEGNATPNNAISKDGTRRMMPDEIRKWLEHLERIEKLRGEMAVEQLSKSLTMFTALSIGTTMEGIQEMIADEESTDPTGGKSPATHTKADMEEMNLDWNALVQDFHSYPPPAECVPIRDTYDVVLKETGGMIIEIVAAIEKSESDKEGAINALMQMKGKSDQRIGKPSKQTDRQVADLCYRYETLKWFSISQDFGSSGLSKFGF